MRKRQHSKILVYLCLVMAFLTFFFLSRWISSRERERLAGEALEYALTRIDRPYRNGGKGPDRFDCSGLVAWAYTSAEPKIQFRRKKGWAGYADANELWRYNVDKISMKKLKPGDLVFMTDSFWKVTHVGLFLQWDGKDEFQYIHASSSRRKVTKSTWLLKQNTRGYRLVGAGKLKYKRPSM